LISLDRTRRTIRFQPRRTADRRPPAAAFLCPDSVGRPKRAASRIKYSTRFFGGNNMHLSDFGFDPNVYARTPDGGSGTPARVTAVHKERYALVCDGGECYGKLKAGVYYGAGTEEFPTTGDFVLIDCNPDGDSQILRTLPRKSYFARRDPGTRGGEQAVAANFDFVFIMQSLNQDFNPKRLDRYLTLAWQSGATPVVVLTKADLTEEFGEQLLIVEQTAAGVNVHAVSAKTGFGLDALSAYLQPGKTVVLLGSSGVGKSSLVNALAHGERMAVCDIREGDDRGRHTTTRRQLLLLDGGAMIIDTPGMRELGMWDVHTGLADAFADVERYFGFCRFSDCRHQTEPGCAVREAIENGELSAERWESYCKLSREAGYPGAAKDRARRERQHQAKTARRQERPRQKPDFDDERD